MIVRPLDAEAWADWVATRPPVIQAMCAKTPPDRLYRMADTGHRVTIYSYNENGTVTVNVTGEFNFVAFERRVFGIDPATLTECDPPVPDELVGSADMTIEEAKAMLAERDREREKDAAMRVGVKP